MILIYRNNRFDVAWRKREESRRMRKYEYASMINLFVCWVLMNKTWHFLFFFLFVSRRKSTCTNKCNIRILVETRVRTGVDKFSPNILFVSRFFSLIFVFFKRLIYRVRFSSPTSFRVFHPGLVRVLYVFLYVT